LVTFVNIATSARSGINALSSSRRLPMTCQDIRLNPVTLPPGRARLSTIPLAIGSELPPMTIGMVPVVCLAAMDARVADATITSTLRSTNSAARAGRRSSSVPAKRYSMLTF